jgi:hypothetical protein
MLDNKPKCNCTPELNMDFSDVRSYGLIRLKPEYDPEAGPAMHSEVVLRLYCCKSCGFAGFTYVRG